jgi:hypothetical protein
MHTRPITMYINTDPRMTPPNNSPFRVFSTKAMITMMPALMV